MSHHTKPEWNDQRIEIIIGTLLKWGVMLAAATVFTGGMLFLLTHGGEHLNYHIFHGAQSPLRSFKGIVSGVMRFEFNAIIQLGLVMLILTPIARVVLSIFAFYKERDQLYVAISSIVLLFLLVSLASGVV